MDINPLLCLVAFVCGVLPLVLLHYSAIRSHKKRNIPHGSMGWPLIGETVSFLKPHKSNSTGEFLESRCVRYGRVFRSHLFGSPTIVSCDHEFNSFIFQNEERLFQSAYPKPLHAVLGELASIIIVGDLHRRLRAVAVAFANATRSNSEYLHSVEKQAISLMESWKEREEINFCQEAKKFAFNVILKHILSMEPEELIAARILKDFLILMKGLVSLPLRIPGTQYAKAVKARARVSSVVREVVSKRRSAKEKGHNKDDFLHLLLSNESLSDEERVSLVFDLLLGGYETTSTLLALAVYFLGQSPTALQQLKEEHQAIRKRKSKEDDERLNWEDYKQMEFTQNVILETLRFGNVVKFVHRKAITDVKYKGLFFADGYLIPRGWKVLPIFSAIHLDPSLHQNASEFYPWRWKEYKSSKTLTPFSGGLRLCPGADLAKVEIAIFLHHLVLNFRWKSSEDDHPMAHPYVEFKKGLPLKIETLE